MQRMLSLRVLLAMMALTTGLAAGAAGAQVPRTVLTELFGATW